MLVVCFGQGLGNQMFQYAFYLALKKKYPGCTVKMDVENLVPKDHNGFELERVFGIMRDECKLKETIKLSGIYPSTAFGGKFISKLFRGLYRFSNSRQSYIHPDNPNYFYPEVFQLNPLYSYIFDGRWANEAYFEDVKKEVKESFQFSNTLNVKNQRYYDEIKNTNSVGIHIRRGDYKNANFGFYLLPSQYYLDALDVISRKEKNLRLFIFTDDMEAVKSEFPFSLPVTYVQGNSGQDSYIDMQLMSKCKHNIIANSTFSYWGAYLNDNPKKIVVAPNRYNKFNQMGFYCSDWVVLDILKYKGILPE